MIRVLQAGLLTTIQDLGRTGFQQYGVVVSGAMDSFAHRVANLLVGNPAGFPSLECTLLGPTLEFTKTSLIAVTGGGMWPSVDGDILPLWRPLLLRAGTILHFLPNPDGCRAYLAVAGGFAIPKVLGSASTYLRAGIGGVQGRAVQRGDVLPVGNPSLSAERRAHRLAQELIRQPLAAVAMPPWFASLTILPYHRRSSLHAIPGPQFDHFTEEAKAAFYQQGFRVDAQSDRMGYRLNGPSLRLSQPHELVSEAVTNGTVQVPRDGNPIVLMADHQTTGGYPKIAQVATADLPLLAQVRPGEQVRFRPVSVEKAQQWLHKQERNLTQLRFALEQTL